jgi:hypothetical protein
VWRWHRDSCPRHVKSRILSRIHVVRQTLLEHPISLVPVNKIYRSPHTNDKGKSGAEILQRDHGHNREDLEPMGAWKWPLSALPRARCRAQATERTLALLRTRPERMSERPSIELAHIFKSHPRTRNTSLHACPHCLDPVLSSSKLCAARPSHPNAGHRGQPFLETPSLTRASGQLPRGAVKLLQAKFETLPHRSSGIPIVGLRPPATARRSGHQVNHSSIPCTHDLPDLSWSSLTHWIVLCRRG